MLEINVLKQRNEVPARDLAKYLMLPSPSLVDAQHEPKAKAQSATPKLAAIIVHKGKKPTTAITNSEPDPLYPGSFGGVGGVVMDTIRDLCGAVKHKLIGGAAESEEKEKEDLDVVPLSQVHEQVTMYSKELQAMNREMFALRKGMLQMEQRLSHKDVRFQTVLKQVKALKLEFAAHKIERDGDRGHRELDEKKVIDDDMGIRQQEHQQEMGVSNGDVDTLSELKSEMAELREKLLHVEAKEEEEEAVSKEVRDLKELYVAISENVVKLDDAQNLSDAKLWEELAALKQLQAGRSESEQALDLHSICTQVSSC